MLNDEEFLDRLTLKRVSFRSRKHCRKCTHDPHKNLKGVDRAGSMLSYEGVESLRNINMISFGREFFFLNQK